MRWLFGSTVRADLAGPTGTLGHDHGRALRVRSGARQLHSRQRGRRQQQDAKFAHVFWFPETIFFKHGLINEYALGWIVAQYKSEGGFISTRNSHRTAAIHISFSLDFQRLGLQSAVTGRHPASPLLCLS